MGCCSNQNVEGGIETPQGDLQRKMNNLTMEELALVIKIQARIRGFLTRKKISAFKVSAGFGAHNFYGADG